MSIAQTTTAARGFQYKHGDRPLEGYAIQRAAGRGGFGEVYYAISDSGREVALKLIQTYEQIELRGISHCMNLKSPHLVTIFDVKYGQDTRPWVIMEFVSGPSLRELLDAAPSGLGVQKSAFFLREIAKGLTYLHECGIVHRDMKPGNIFYENGYVKIGDYGLSKAMSTSQHSGQTVTVGTVHYMAPEIGEGRYDKSIDIYALGVLLFEMLTGQVPFFGASPTEVLMKHLSGQVDLTGVEEPFATVIRKSMAKNPVERYQSVQEMVEAVFGSEHVRNSVSTFTPESLTMVAGQVARKLPGNADFSNSSGPAGQPPAPGNPWDRFGKNVEQAVNRMNQTVAEHVDRVVNGKLNHVADKMDARRQKMEQRWAAKRQKMEERWARWQNKHGWWAGGQQAAQQTGQPQQNQLNPTPAGPVDDPVSPAQRRALTAVAIGLVAVGTGMASGHNTDVAAAALFTGLAVFGSTLGILIGTRRLWPGLPPEPKLLRKLAAGGCAALLAAIFSLPVAVNDRAVQDLGGTWLALLICMFIINWQKSTAINRPMRVNFGQVVVALILGGFIGTAFHGAGPLIAGIVGGTSLAVQIASAWSPSATGNGRRGFPAVYPAPQMPGIPTPLYPTAAPAAEITPSSPVAAGAPPANGTTPAAVGLAPTLTLRPVPRGARIIWLTLFIACSTLGLFLWCALAANVTNDHGEAALMFAFGALSLILATFSLKRNFQRSFSGYWPYIGRPFLQIACIGSILACLSMLTIGELSHENAPPAIFFTIFPAVILVVLTFLTGHGDSMSQATLIAGSQPGADQQNEGFIVGRILGGASRMVFNLIALAILLAATVLALGVAADVPGLFNSHLVPPEVSNDMHQTFGEADWPRLMRAMGAGVSFVLAVIGVIILLKTRRRFGALHMLRALAGPALMLLSIVLISHALPAWNELVRTENGWEFLDQYLRHINDHRIIGAVLPAGLALIVLLWPGERRRTPRFVVVKEEIAR